MEGHFLGFCRTGDIGCLYAIGYKVAAHPEATKNVHLCRFIGISERGLRVETIKKRLAPLIAGIPSDLEIFTNLLSECYWKCLSISDGRLFIC